MEDHGEGSPEFYKIVYEPVSQGLRLPTRFMENHGHSLNGNTVVTLYVPTGSSWSVRLHDTDTGLWLGRGWQQFAAHHEIEARHFLYFKYEGSARFRVVIFHPRGSEIDYPLKGDEGDEEMPDLDENPGCIAATISPEEKKKCVSYQKATGFTSENPCILSFMQPSYVTDSYILSLNSGNVKDFFPKDTSIMHVSVQVSVPGSNKVWPMNWNVYSKRRKATAAKGWRTFVEDNQLLVGDACVFELVNQTDMHFKVTIFRNT